MLELKNISFQTESGKRILNDVSLTIPDGKLVALTGPNGGGKTTLAKLIAGIERPTSGTILLDGKDISDLDPTERAKSGISFAFQQPVRFKGISVRDILNIAGGGNVSEEALKDVLTSVGLNSADYLDRALGSHLSGGEIKRIEIATVLIRKSKVAVFDEPEAGIDLWSFNSLIRVFENLRETRRCSLIIISHQERILSISDDIALISEGRVGLHGSRSSIFPRLLCKNSDCNSCCSFAKEVAAANE